MWARLEYPTDTYHVVPVDDVRDHEQTSCWCKPKTERYENGNTMIAHNSADFREFYEQNTSKQGH